MGILKSVVDSITRNIPENTKILNPKYRDPMALAVKTSNLRDSIEIDPEVTLPSAQEIPGLKDKIYQLYRHKGDIKIKDLILYKYVPYDSIDSNIIKQIMEDKAVKHQREQNLLKLNDMGAKFKDKEELFKPSEDGKIHLFDNET